MQLLCCTFRRVQILSLLIGVSVIVAILMILFFFTYPSIVRQRIIDQVIIKNNSDAIERFRSTKEIKSLRLEFHTFTVINVDDVINNGAKIKLQEIGPFVYKELKNKEFLDNNQTNGLITYKQRIKYTLDRANSVADPTNITITWPNIPLLVAQAYIDDLSFLKKISAYFFINKSIKSLNEQAFITDTVQNFLFDGSKRKLFEYLQTYADILHLFKRWPLKDNMFALLYGKNNTWNYETDYIMTSSAGFGINQTYTNLNEYVYLNGSARMPFWKNDPANCNQVGGTDGQFFHPFLSDERSKLKVYSANVCRKLDLKFMHSSFINGIPASKYVLNEKTLSSVIKNPENQCYCLENSETNSTSSCQIDGLIDLTTCNNPNVFASGAHFYAGSPSLLSRIDGLSPANDTLHEPVIYIEPNTGYSIKVKVPLQFNIRLIKNDFKIFDWFKDDEPLIIPLVWIEEAAELTDDQASMLRSKLLLLDSWFVSMVLGGSIIFVLAISVLTAILCIKFKDSQRSMVPQSSLDHTIEADETDPLLVTTEPAARSYSSSQAIDAIQNVPDQSAS